MPDEKFPKEKIPKVIDIGTVRRRPDFKEIDRLFKLGLSLFETNPRKAKEYFLEVVKAIPDHAVAWLNLGTLCEELGERGEAINNYEKAIESDPECANAYHNLAILMEESGNFFRALFCYEQYLKFTDDAEDNPFKNTAKQSVARLKKTIKETP